MITKMKRFLYSKAICQILTRSLSTQELVSSRQIFSAIQPTGSAHLGNYLGAIRKWVDLQNSEKNPVIYAIADLHSISIPQDPKELNDNIFSMAATLLGCGIDTDKCIFFLQSMVPQHAELSWILGTLTTMARLSHLPQFKEKCQLVKDSPVGLFLYPVLQTADIMLYKTTHVPVGEDQTAQLDLAMHLIKAFNNRFGSLYPIPKTIVDSSSGRIKSLLDPSKKMSKSDLNTKSVINLLDEPSEIIMKCKKALTDFTSEVTYEPQKRLGVANLITIHSSIAGKSPQEIVQEVKHLNSGQYKLFLAEIIIEHLKPIREKIINYLNSREFLISELEKGADKARNIAEDTLKDVKERVGFDLSCLRSGTHKWVTCAEKGRKGFSAIG